MKPLKIIGCLATALSWIIFCGIVKLITLCFGWTFSWGTATNIWLFAYLLGVVAHYCEEVNRDE